MKCGICNKQAGFMKFCHNECENQKNLVESALQETLESYIKREITADWSKKQIKNIVNSSELYCLYMTNCARDYRKAIRTNETILFVEQNLKITESKNRCTMMSTGYRYEKKPYWRETQILLGKYVTVVFTDVAIYVMTEQPIRYEYKKVVNIGCEKGFNYNVYFDVKTSSPYAHRFCFYTDTKKDIDKLKNIYYYFLLFTGFNENK